MFVFAISPGVWGQQAVLDNFNSGQIRSNNGQTPLWSAYLGENPIQTLSIVNGVLTDVTGAGSSPYIQFMPVHAAISTYYPWATPCVASTCGRTQAYLLNGAWSPAINRLKWRMKCDVSALGLTGGAIQFGTYDKQPDDPDASLQGQHFYHFLSPNFRPNQWIQVTMNSVPDHEVGNGVQTKNYSAKVLGDAAYYDSLGRFYLDWQASNAVFHSSTCQLDDFTFDTVSNEPDVYVHGISGAYSGSAYEVVFGSLRYHSVVYQIRYSASSLKSIGFSAGTDGGTVTNTADAYTNVNWTSPTTNQSPSLYVGIRPIMPVNTATNTSPINVSTYFDNNFATGDVVSLSGVGGNTRANGTWTIKARSGVEAVGREFDWSGSLWFRNDCDCYD